MRELEGAAAPDQGPGQPAGRPPRPGPQAHPPGRNGQLYQNYQEGVEDQIGALGLVSNAIVLFDTRSMDAALTHLRTSGSEAREEDVARLAPFVRHHINLMGRQLPEMPGGLRPLSPVP
ncbi:Tn3 family transposase [Nonomuraea sp. NPDC003727]